MFASVKRFRSMKVILGSGRFLPVSACKVPDGIRWSILPNFPRFYVRIRSKTNGFCPGNSGPDCSTWVASFHRLIDGALFRVVKSSQTTLRCSHSTPNLSDNGFIHSNQRLRLAVPKLKTLELLSLAHDHPTAAHLGTHKTFSRLSSRFTWSYMRRDVAAYVRSCLLCQQHKSSNQYPGGLMRPTVVGEP
ncbi:unnamed protein product [Adineta ricciae]|uniref:Integrase zinc-binding domain-containing protein n=1 Tax=Adineta ricciae TaxID=249248 RepID=A0A816DGR7_ADIRI|nr:unnamed protein product [Adineta ricciae]